MNLIGFDGILVFTNWAKFSFASFVGTRYSWICSDPKDAASRFDAFFMGDFLPLFSFVRDAKMVFAGFKDEDGEKDPIFLDTEEYLRRLD